MATSVNVNVYRKAPSMLPPSARRGPPRESRASGWSTRECTHRNLLLEQPAWLRRGESMGLTQRRKQPIGRFRAEREQLLAHRVVQAQVPVLFKRGDQFGRNGTSRLPQIPFAAVQAVASACWTSTP